MAELKIGDKVSCYSEQHQYHYIVTAISGREVRIKAAATGRIDLLNPGTDCGWHRASIFDLEEPVGIASKEDLEALYNS